MSRLYSTWSAMKQRCSNPKNSQAKYYYSKGIRVCDEWLDFKNFEKWALKNGYRDDLTIDRIDNSKGYFPDNCQWITKSENSRKAGKEIQGIWQVYRMDSAFCIEYSFYDDEDFFKFGTKIAEGLSYSEAIRIEAEHRKSNRMKRYRVLNIYGEGRKVCFHYTKKEATE